MPYPVSLHTYYSRTNECMGRDEKGMRSTKTRHSDNLYYSMCVVVLHRDESVKAMFGVPIVVFVFRLLLHPSSISLSPVRSRLNTRPDRRAHIARQALQYPVPHQAMPILVGTGPIDRRTRHRRSRPGRAILERTSNSIFQPPPIDAFPRPAVSRTIAIGVMSRHGDTGRRRLRCRSGTFPIPSIRPSKEAITIH